MSIIQGSADGALAFLMTAALPPVVYAATHHVSLFHWVHFWSLLLLGSGPLLFITILKGGARAWKLDSAPTDARHYIGR